MTGVVVDTEAQVVVRMVKQDAQLSAYRECINKIDDYLEYQRESEKDQIHILAMIDKLTGTLAGIEGTS